MSIRIQEPTLGRIVLFTSFRGHEEKELDEYAALITKVHHNGVVDLATFGSSSLYHKTSIPYDADGRSGSWRYPIPTHDTIDID